MIEGIGGMSGFGQIGGAGFGQIGAGQGGFGGMEGISAGGDAGGADGKGFADVLKEVVVDGPSAAYQDSAQLGQAMAAGANIDPHQLAIASAISGVEIQMATRTISSAVSGLRTLLQMQI